MKAHECVCDLRQHTMLVIITIIILATSFTELLLQLLLVEEQTQEAALFLESCIRKRRAAQAKLENKF